MDEELCLKAIKYYYETIALYHSPSLNSRSGDNEFVHRRLDLLKFERDFFVREIERIKALKGKFKEKH